MTNYDKDFFLYLSPLNCDLFVLFVLGILSSVLLWINTEDKIKLSFLNWEL